jgi:hypothetical protein
MGNGGNMDENYNPELYELGIFSRCRQIKLRKENGLEFRRIVVRSVEVSDKNCLQVYIKQSLEHLLENR